MRQFYKATLLMMVALASLMAMAHNDAQKKGKVANTPAPIADAQYLIGKEDILSIQVWREPELTRLVAVRADGKISLPLVGEVEAAGKTPLVLQSELTQLLDQYMKAPQISVTVQDARSQRFSIIGEVMRPGSFPLVKPMTVLDALSLAGGFREFAKTEKMFVLRIAPDGTRRKIPVAYKKIISVKGTGQNIELEVHDTLVVP
jgi:polysaccharide export outer membrane protein